MPKEYVHDTRYLAEYVSYGLDGKPVAIDNPPKSFQVKVGWNKETGDVQIATVDESEDVDQFSAAGGLHVSLDRQGINDLIRYLRRARDQAFGRDE